MWYLDVHTEENIIKNMNRFGYLPKIAEYIGTISIFKTGRTPFRRCPSQKNKKIKKIRKKGKTENRKRNISRRLQQGKTAYRDAAKRR